MILEIIQIALGVALGELIVWAVPRLVWYILVRRKLG